MGSEADDAIELRVGDERVVSLPGLGTAGYRWAPHLEGDAGVADVVPGGTERKSGGAVGASGDETFAIRARHAGATRIRFEQRRPWESDEAAAVDERTIRLRVI